MEMIKLDLSGVKNFVDANIMSELAEKSKLYNHSSVVHGDQCSYYSERKRTWHHGYCEHHSILGHTGHCLLSECYSGFFLDVHQNCFLAKGTILLFPGRY